MRVRVSQLAQNLRTNPRLNFMADCICDVLKCIEDIHV